jgi:hypothetical protein
VENRNSTDRVKKSLQIICAHSEVSDSKFNEVERIYHGVSTVTDPSCSDATDADVSYTHLPGGYADVDRGEDNVISLVDGRLDWSGRVSGDDSESSYSAAELETVIHKKVRALLKLARRRGIIVGVRTWSSAERRDGESDGGGVELVIQRSSDPSPWEWVSQIGRGLGLRRFERTPLGPDKEYSPQSGLFRLGPRV